MNQQNGVQRKLINKKISKYFLPLCTQVEKLIKVSLLLLILCLFLVQFILHTNEEYQTLTNKTIRYEGVFHEDQIEAKATLQRR